MAPYVTERYSLTRGCCRSRRTVEILGLIDEEEIDRAVQGLTKSAAEIDCSLRRIPVLIGANMGDRNTGEVHDGRGEFPHAIDGSRIGQRHLVQIDRTQNAATVSYPMAGLQSNRI